METNPQEADAKALLYLIECNDWAAVALLEIVRWAAAPATSIRDAMEPVIRKKALAMLGESGVQP